jgi:transcriptional regulator with XRE-family HTH domain
MPAKVEPLTLQQVVAKNVRRLRHEKELRQEDVATAARRSGLRWTAVTVTQLESGNRSITMEEFVLLPMMLRCSLKDLIHHEELIQVTDTALLPAATIESLVSDRPIDASFEDDVPWIPALEEELDTKVKDAVWRAHFVPSLLSYLLVREGSQGEAERKAAITLKAMSPAEVAAYSLRCWGRTLTEERDLRAAEQGSNKEARAVRGHITRTLLECIQKERLGALARRRSENPLRLTTYTQHERDLNRIMIKDYETNERTRKRAQLIYEEWMLIKVISERKGETPKPRNQPRRGEPLTERAAREKVRPKK